MARQSNSSVRHSPRSAAAAFCRVEACFRPVPKETIPTTALGAKAMLADLAVTRGDLSAAERLARKAMEQGTGEGGVAATMALGGVLAPRATTRARAGCTAK